MNRCGYYSCKNGIRKCSNPTKDFTDLRKMGTDYCKMCKLTSGGIYPSQLQEESFTHLEYDVLDTNEIVLN